MAEMRTSYNWLLSVSGTLAVIFGLTTLFYPGLPLLSLYFLFGLFAVASGVVMLYGSMLHSRRFSHWGSRMFEGIITMIVGLGVLAYRGLTLAAFAYIAGAWAIISGLDAVYNAIQFSAHRGLNIFHAIVSFVFAGLLIANPMVGLLPTSWLVGIYSLLFGIDMITYAATTNIAEMETSEVLEREYDELERRREKDFRARDIDRIERRSA